MKSAFAAIFLLYSGLTFAAVENIVSMQRDGAGTFNVICDNKGVSESHMGITADAVRSDDVCSGQIQIPILEEGHYTTSSDFCEQTVRWSGDQMLVDLSQPCAGTMTLDKFQDGWYRGKLAGYEYIYEVQVKSTTSYMFYSRSFGTDGGFTKAAANYPGVSKITVKRGFDPARN